MDIFFYIVYCVVLCSEQEHSVSVDIGEILFATGDSGKYTSVFQQQYYNKVTGFAKRGLPHPSNSMNSENHNSVFKKHINLKLSPSTKLCWCSLLTKF